MSESSLLPSAEGMARERISREAPDPTCLAHRRQQKTAGVSKKITAAAEISYRGFSSFAKRLDSWVLRALPM